MAQLSPSVSISLRQAPPSIDRDRTYREAALNSYPFAWYERLDLAALSFAVIILGFWTQRAFSLFPDLYLSLAGLLMHLIGWFYDIHSTHKVLQLKTQFDKAHLEFPLYEAGIFLSAEPSLSKQIFNLNTLLHLFLLPLSILIPSIGAATGISSFLAGLGNWRQRDRLEVMLRETIQRHEQNEYSPTVKKNGLKEGEPSNQHMEV